MCRFLAAIALATCAIAQVNLQVPPDLKFEVASLKPAAPDQRGAGIRPAPGGERYVASNATLKTMLSVAYRIRPEQITGGPDWVDNDRFDMNAKAEKPSNPEELHAMLINLLVERFQLKFHRDKKDM
ncbi:MAG TPA: TIGR03435 family protein, partial [Bryobacteraceae bacterium]|nr:TIGR03435 family protein [Bryobacteraceae bacterium]